MKTKFVVGLLASSSLWIACGGNVVGTPGADGGSVSPNNPADGGVVAANPAARVTTHCTTMSDKAKQCQSRGYSSDECTNDATCALAVFEPTVAENVLKCAESGTCRTDLDDCIEDASSRTTPSAAAKALQATCEQWANTCHSRWTNCDLDGYVLMNSAMLATFSKCFASGCNMSPTDCMRKELAAVSPACAAATGGNTNNGGGGSGGGGNVPIADAGTPTPIPVDAGKP